MLILPFSAIIDALNIKVFRVLADEYLAILPAARALKTSGAIAIVKNILVFLRAADMNMTREEMKNWKCYMMSFLMNVPSVIIDISADMASSRAITEDATSVLNVDIPFVVPSLPSTIVEGWTREK